MDVHVSWLAVVVAVMVGMAIAMVWYSDWGLVGGSWRTLTGVTKADSARVGARPMIVLAASIIVTALTLAAACAIASAAFRTDAFWLDLGAGVAVWLGFSLSTLAQHNGFEQKPVRLTAINGAYQFVLFTGMALAIGLIQ